jgi:dTDP-4-amino-4,6-dideoxygalactose transaminase
MSGESLMSADLYYSDALSKYAISGLTNRMLKAFVPDEIKRIRRRNYCLLVDILHEQENLKILYPELPNGVCPLNFPIILENRDIVRLELYKRGIDADAFGKCYHKYYALHDYPDSNFLKNHILSLPIHQNLDAENIRYIADNLINILVRLKK